MSVNSGLKATKIIGQRKAFYRQTIIIFVHPNYTEIIKVKLKLYNWGLSVNPF